jgi:hypothetical protein
MSELVENSPCIPHTFSRTYVSRSTKLKTSTKKADIRLHEDI